MTDLKTMRSIPTVASLDGAVRRLAAALVNLEGEFNSDEGQLSKIWESIEELNLRVLFLMNTLQITVTLSPIADHTGKIPQLKVSALEAYMQHGGREKLIAGIEAQAKAAEQKQQAQQQPQGDQPMKVEVYEGLPTAEQGGAASADEGKQGATAADKRDDGYPTYVNNPSKFDKQ